MNNSFAGLVPHRITLPGSASVEDTKIATNPVTTNAISSNAISTNTVGSKAGTEKVPFAQVMDNALQNVSNLGQEADQMRTDYELGVSSDLTSTMITSEKASISFQATIQVRNRVVSAYETVFNMPV